MAKVYQINRVPQIGDIYMVDFDGTGSVQSGIRPAIVFQNNTGNVCSPNLVVLPLTSRLKKISMPTHVIIRSKDSGLVKDSMALCENPQCISKDKLGRYITTLSDDYMKQIAAASIIASSAISFMDIDLIMKAWKTAIQLNAVCEAVTA